MRIDIASTFSSKTPILGDVSRDLPTEVNRISAGMLELTFREPSALVPIADTVKAVSEGRVVAAWAGAGWFAASDSAYTLFFAVPFGPAMGEYLAWFYNGGGLELAREMFHAKGVHNIPCGMIPPEASGWFRKEIRTTADLKGLHMRFSGLGARVMQKHGVIIEQLAPDDILAAMESGRLDAAEFSTPAMDRPLGLSKLAKFYYFPGWHQQATLFHLYINKAVWDGLSQQHQGIIEVTCGDIMRRMISTGEATQWEAMKQLQAEGVQLKRWPPEILVSFEDAWLEIVKEESQANPNFARVYKSYSDFRENYAIWRHFSSLK